MAKLSTRQQNIRKAKGIRRFEALTHQLQDLFRKPQGKQIFIDTKFGKVRTLWYGFEKAEKAPIFFDLHGGGFILGRPEMDEAINLRLSEQVGCKIISIDYAKAPDFPYPAAVNQVYAVVKGVFENAKAHGIDVNKMAIGGHSAGGNLSTVTCMKAKKEGGFRFACQVLDYPPLDLATSPFDKPQPKGTIPPQMAAMFDSSYVDPIQAKDPYVSPVYAAPEALQGLPPALFILAGGCPKRKLRTFWTTSRRRNEILRYVKESRGCRGML